MTCAELQILRTLQTTISASAGDNITGVSMLIKAVRELRLEHEEINGCMCWYRNLAREGKPLLPEVQAKIDAQDRERAA